MTDAIEPLVDPSRLGRRDELTFRANLKEARYGWLRLTPAYSVHLVTRLLEQHATVESRVLDPFCGTGTTALVCAERGIPCDTTDINPFLVWLARAKTRRYTPAGIGAFVTASRRIATAMVRPRATVWTPPIHAIERWWSPPALLALGRARAAIVRARETLPSDVADLLDVAFCRAMIESASVSFGHQSMSFAKGDHAPCGEGDVAERFTRAAISIARAAASPIPEAPTAHLADARDLSLLPKGSIDCVLTSPPYPNRMSYVRELRPYMYWLGYLTESRDAGELDWRAIGGTWGCATSNVAKWTPPAGTSVPFDGFEAITSAIAERSDVLARYVAKYFHDTVLHARSLYSRMARGGTVHYIVGNSKFYDVVLPVESIYASLFEAAGFRQATITTIRKRTSKKELFEFVVSASKR